MRSLGLPDKPIPRDEEDPLVPASVEEKPKAKAIDEEEAGSDSAEGSKSELEAGEESMESLLV
jgi:hypothetical protein